MKITKEMIDAGMTVNPNDYATRGGWVWDVLQAALTAAPEPQMTGAQWLNRPLYDEEMTNLRERVKELELLNHAARVSLVRHVNENQRLKAKMTRHGDDDELMQATQRLLAVLIRRADAS